ncbi:hypothetical protein [Devosia sp. MC1541]|uniref:hypothetical protein n=1 Tax=Devosia sp. MC1541 TaxID=2725264 RepID=UPI00145DB6F1|nr:hypothetical protein [Devosia sp. MC1541]
MATAAQRLTTTSSKSRQWSVLALSALLVLAPIASGARGLDASLGRALIAAVDVALVAYFMSTLTSKRSGFDVLIAAMIGYAFVQWAFFVNFPGIEGAVQGFRKTFVLLVAISVGRHIKDENHSFIRASIVFSLIYVCLYGIKQRFYFDSFDQALLNAQSSDFYSNVIDNQIRSLSLLSGAFHLGTAACVLAMYAIFKSGLSKTKRLLLWAVAVGACYSSLTRTFLIIIFAVPLLTFLMQSKARLVVGIYITVLGVALLDFFSGGLVSTEFWALVYDDRLRGRSVSYLGFAEYWTEFPGALITGFGLGSAGSGLGEVFAQSGSIWNEPHNVFLKYVFELGIPLGCVALWIFFYFTKAAWLNAGRDRWVYVAMMLVLAVAGLTITSVEVWPINIYVGILIGMASRPSALSRPEVNLIKA